MHERILHHNNSWKALYRGKIWNRANSPTPLQPTLTGSLPAKTGTRCRTTTQETQTVLSFGEKKKLCCHTLHRLSDSTKLGGGVAGPLRFVCAVVILYVRRDQRCEVWEEIEEWTQTKAWWKRLWGWKNLRHRYKAESKFVLAMAISNHWFEMSGPSKARNKKPLLQVLLHCLSPGNSTALAMIQTNRMGRDKKWAFFGILSGVVVAMAARTAVTRSNDENSLFVLLLRPFADVSNLHCGFIKLFPKRRVTLVEGFSSESFLWKVFCGDWHVLQNVLNPGKPCALWTFNSGYVTCGSKRSHAVFARVFAAESSNLIPRYHKILIYDRSFLCPG